jgi:hypothetical protein
MFVCRSSNCKHLLDRTDFKPAPQNCSQRADLTRGHTLTEAKRNVLEPRLDNNFPAVFVSNWLVLKIAGASHCLTAMSKFAPIAHCPLSSGKQWSELVILLWLGWPQVARIHRLVLTNFHFKYHACYKATFSVANSQDVDMDLLRGVSLSRTLRGGGQGVWVVARKKLGCWVARWTFVAVCSTRVGSREADEVWSSTGGFKQKTDALWCFRLFVC